MALLFDQPSTYSEINNWVQLVCATTALIAKKKSRVEVIFML